LSLIAPSHSVTQLTGRCADSFLECPLTALASSFAFKPGKNALLYFAGVVVVVVVVIVDVELGGSLF
jgi:hypothetical protein